MNNQVIPTLCDPMDCSMPASLSFTISWSLFTLMSTESLMTSNHFILSLPFLLPSMFPSIRIFSENLALHIRWPEYCGFGFSISSSNEHSGLTSFRIDCFDLFAVQGFSSAFSNTTVQKHQFFSTQPSLWYNSHIHT